MFLWLAMVACTAPTPDSADTAQSDDTGVDTGVDTGLVPPCMPPEFGAPLAIGDMSLPAPTWEKGGLYRSFGSPRLIDINGDGTLDVVSGKGTEETNGDPLHTFGLAMVQSGVDGEPMWQTDARQELFTTAALLDLTGDGIEDPVFGGRHAELIALDAVTGDPLWSFAMDVEEARDNGLYNFYSVQVINDIDADGVPDFLAANGGDSTKAPEDDRPSAHIALVSGATGEIVYMAETPDQAETYMSPLLIGDQVIFGTGGETRVGGLWRAPISAIVAGDLSGAEKLVDTGGKGAIAPPSLADLTGDCVPDVIISTMDGALAAHDGDSGLELWRHEFAGHETYLSPTIGFFTGDGVPDVYAAFFEGTWPIYMRARHVVVDGASGELLWDQEIGITTMSGAVAADWDGDGLDEVIFGANNPASGGALEARLYTLDVTTMTAQPISGAYDRMAVANPWLGDMDGDGLLELIHNTMDIRDEDDEWRTYRYDLDVAAPQRISWGAYLGTRGDGILHY